MSRSVVIDLGGGKTTVLVVRVPADSGGEQEDLYEDPVEETF